MEFIKDNIYHIYNQGNNRQKIFYNRDNYLFFLQKMNDYLLPYCDVLAWCLMPNHFHWMVYVRESELEIPTREGVFIKDALSDSLQDDLKITKDVSQMKQMLDDAETEDVVLSIYQFNRYVSLPIR